MKRLILAAAASIVLFGGTAYAGIFDSIITSDWEVVKSIHYKLEAYGFDLRVYEWQPVLNPNMTCVTGFSEVGSIGIQCFEKE